MFSTELFVQYSFSSGAIRWVMIAGFHRRRVRGPDGQEILYCISSPFTRRRTNHAISSENVQFCCFRTLAPICDHMIFEKKEQIFVHICAFISALFYT